jgi:predicted dehydrogenase
METVRVGVIGIGGMGSNHARQLHEGSVGNAKLAAVCDTNPERLKWARETLGEDVKCFGSSDAFFDAQCVDAVMIGTPHYLHPPLAIEGLKRGLHVLTEKPAGVYTRQVREMNEAAAASDRVFGIMYNQRTTKSFQKLRDLLQSGELGEMKRVIYIITNWFRSQSYYDSGGWRATWEGEGGGVLLNQCPHNLDLWQWVCGMPQRVRAFMAFGKYHDIEVEDDVTAYVEYPNGATGLFVTTTGEAPGTNRLEIGCDRGKVILEGNQITFWRTRVPVSEFNRTYKGGFGEPEVWKCDIPGGGGGGHVEIMQNWVSAIRTGSDLLAPGEEGIRGLSLSNAMMLSAWTDNWVDLPVDEDLFYEKLQEQIRTSKSTKDSSASKTLDVEGSHNS